MSGNQHIRKSQQALKYIILSSPDRIDPERTNHLPAHTHPTPDMPIFEDFSPSITASVSITAPRLVLISITPRFMRVIAAAIDQMMRFWLSGQCRVMISLSA